MGLLDELNNEQAAPAKPYTFLTGEDDNFIKDLRAPKQSIIREETLNEMFSGEEENAEMNSFLGGGENSEASVLSLADYENLAGFMVTSLDIPASYGLAALAKDKDNREQFLMTPHEAQSGTKALGKYLQTKGGEIPAWLTLVIVFVGIYAGKVIGAMQLRAAKLKEEKLEAELANSQSLIKALEARLNKTENATAGNDTDSKE